MYVYIVALACGGFPSPAQNITPLDMGYLTVISCVLLPVAFILLATGPRYVSAAEVSLYMEVCILCAVCAVSTIYIYVSSCGTCVHILYMHECDLYMHTAILTCIVFTYYMCMYRPLIIHPIHPSLLSLFLHLPLLSSPLDRDGSGPCICVSRGVRATSTGYYMRRGGIVSSIEC